MKRKLLFVIESLATAGAEKSLVALLNELDYSQYDVDLQLFAYGKHFESFLPKEVNLLQPLEYFAASENTLADSLFSFSLKQYRFLIKRISYSLLLRGRKLNNLNKAKWLWKIAGKSIRPSHRNEYDVAIAYAQGLPTYYVKDSVRALKKICWVNVSLTLTNNDNPYQLRAYKAFDKVVCVSEKASELFVATFPSLKTRVSIIYDINSEKLTKTIKNQAIDISLIDNSKIKILTMGRLAYGKGYDLAIESAAVLRDKGLKFKWYFLGDGLLKEQLKRQVVAQNLSDYIVFIPATPNPLVIIDTIDIYVQPSRYEGFGLALFEARMLGKPCVATDFETAPLQISHNVNGQIVSMSAIDISAAILKYINNKTYKETICEEQKNCNFFNSEEVLKFVQLVDEVLY